MISNILNFNELNSTAEKQNKVISHQVFLQRLKSYFELLKDLNVADQLIFIKSQLIHQKCRVDLLQSLEPTEMGHDSDFLKRYFETCSEHHEMNMDEIRPMLNGQENIHKARQYLWTMLQTAYQNDQIFEYAYKAYRTEFDLQHFDNNA